MEGADPEESEGGMGNSTIFVEVGIGSLLSLMSIWRVEQYQRSWILVLLCHLIMIEGDVP